MTNKPKWGLIDLLLLLLGLVPAVVTFMVYDKLPEQVAIHFGPDGRPNGYQSKLSFLIVFELMVIGLPLLIKIFRFMDPKRSNYETFGRVFDITRVALTLLLCTIFGNILLFNLGYEEIHMQRYVLGGVGAVLMVSGNYMGRLRHNYMIGIRTPWTLENEEVWRRTHRMAGPLTMLAGFGVVIAAFFPGTAAFWTLIAAALVSGFVPAIYSYVLYRRLGGTNRG
ncbi:SdpI family protein [Paenibacillus sp. P26]|nr:SdpI family protein [Paenibacillus sp. P26]